jgi:hypothetical protein
VDGDAHSSFIHSFTFVLTRHLLLSQIPLSKLRTSSHQHLLASTVNLLTYQSTNLPTYKSTTRYRLPTPTVYNLPDQPLPTHRISKNILSQGFSILSQGFATLLRSKNITGVSSTFHPSKNITGFSSTFHLLRSIYPRTSDFLLRSIWPTLLRDSIMFTYSFSYMLSEFLFKGINPMSVSGNSPGGSILEMLTQTARATVTPTNKKRRVSSDSTKRAFTKPVNASVTDKDIFELAYPKGYVHRIDPTDDGGNLLDDSYHNDDDMSSVLSEGTDITPMKRTAHKYYCVCSKCGHEIGTHSKTHYTNAASHARTCFGKQKLIEVCACLLFFFVNTLFLF